MSKKKERIIGDDEIDLMALLKKAWTGRKIIFITTFVTFLLGVLVAFTSPKVYEANCVLLPEYNKSSLKKMKGLSSLAGLAGFGTNDNGFGVMTPDIYPKIVESTPFLLNIIDDTVYFKKRKIRTTPAYYFNNLKEESSLSKIKKYTIKLPWTLLKGEKEKKIREKVPSTTEPFYQLSKYDATALKAIKKSIIVEKSKKSGAFEVSVNMPDPYAAAGLARLVEENLTEFVIDYKTKKARDNLKFVKNGMNEARRRYDSLQRVMAYVKDRNYNVSSTRAQLELERLKDENQLAFKVYSGLVTQHEQAKIKLLEETPVLTVLEPVKLKNKPVEPRMKTIIALCTLGGAFLSFLFLMIRPLIIELFKV